MMWRERIQAARERGGRFTHSDQADANNDDRRRGGPYACCAVGEQADRYGDALIFDLPKRYGVQDRQLLQDGASFSGAVYVNDFVEAEYLLDAIEDRALQLKCDQDRREHGSFHG